MISFPERFPVSKALELVLDSISGDNSEVEDLSDNDEPVDDVDFHPPQQEPSSSEEESSGDEDPIPQATRGRKRLRAETCRSDRSTVVLRTPRRRIQQVESDGSNEDPEEPTPGPSFEGQPKQGRGVHWKAAPLTPNLAQFEPEEETEQDREGWTPLDYLNQYIDQDLIKLIVYCSNVNKRALHCYTMVS